MDKIKERREMILVTTVYRQDVRKQLFKDMVERERIGGASEKTDCLNGRISQKVWHKSARTIGES